MSRKRIREIDTSGDGALMWFFIGMLVIAVVAGLLGQVRPF